VLLYKIVLLLTYSQKLEQTVFLKLLDLYINNNGGTRVDQGRKELGHTQKYYKSRKALYERQKTQMGALSDKGEALGTENDHLIQL
jgi:hypothetical protein